jgi:hypothetical protein
MISTKIAGVGLAALAVCLSGTNVARAHERPAAAAPAAQAEASETAPRYEYRLLATLRTGTMQKELDEAAAAGFRFMSFMKGGTAFGGDEVVAILARGGRGPAGGVGFQCLFNNISRPPVF